MPWRETEPMLERAQFVAAVTSGEFSFAECCRRFGVSRRIGYKWWQRYQAEGAAGLAEQSRAPHRCPHAVAPALVAQILQAKHAHPHWGPRKLRPYLLQRYPELPWPARSTLGDVLDRHGLVAARRAPRRRVPPASAPLAHCQEVNQVWSADFKGQFRLGNQRWCYPFTLSDNHSRYLLACHGLHQPTEAGVWALCERVFRDYGLPMAIRTDNGAPFASRALGGLTRLAVWWLKLGITPARIAPGQPQQNSRHERMHRTLKAEATQPAAACLAAQQRRFDRFHAEYNHERPHEALGDRTPASVHRHSSRPYPQRLPRVEYDHATQVRRVRTNGAIKWRGGLYFVSEVLVGEPVGLMPISNDRWQLYFAHLPLAVLDDRLGCLIHPG